MPKYRKKPVVVEAVQWNGDNYAEIVAMGGSRDIELGPINLHIHTLEGRMVAYRGDFIIKGLSGELYPCKPDIFKRTYDSAELEGPEELYPGMLGTGSEFMCAICPKCNGVVPLLGPNGCSHCEGKGEVLTDIKIKDLYGWVKMVCRWSPEFRDFLRVLLEDPENPNLPDWMEITPEPEVRVIPSKEES